jgi:hypothetical protein
MWLRGCRCGCRRCRRCRCQSTMTRAASSCPRSCRCSRPSPTAPCAAGADVRSCSAAAIGCTIGRSAASIRYCCDAAAGAGAGLLAAAAAGARGSCICAAACRRCRPCWLQEVVEALCTTACCEVCQHKLQQLQQAVPVDGRALQEQVRPLHKERGTRGSYLGGGLQLLCRRTAVIWP